MSKQILVSGINGFVGKHLARALVNADWTVSGITQEGEIDSEIKELVTSCHICDLTDKTQVSALDLAGYDVIINLAGLANVGQSFQQPQLYKSVNVKVLSNLCQRVLDQKLALRVIAISTGAVYANNQAMPLTEDSTLIDAGSPYALSKIAMEREAKRFREKGLDCIVIRPFNHIGPGQKSGFLLPDLYQRITHAVESNGMIRVGNTNTRRDYTDVRDVVKAYTSIAAADELKYAVYNVCSGHSIAGNQILQLLLEAMGQSGKVTVEQDPALVRPNDPSDLFGDNARICEATNWQPTISLEQTVLDFVAMRNA